jgi:hypothetical protein
MTATVATWAVAAAQVVCSAVVVLTPFEAQHVVAVI